MSKKMVYIAGDMLKKGSQLLREQEKIDIEALGYEVYSPKDDKEINDKSAQTVESNNSLAEKIVKKDTLGILKSDKIVIEPTNDACGTMVELGQIKGMKDMSAIISNAVVKGLKNRNDNVAIIAHVLHLCKEMLGKDVYPHYEDVRRTDIPEQGDRRSFGVNQYVYGTCLALTDGVGFYEWNDILKRLEETEEEKDA